MKKLWHKIDHALEFEGKKWTLNASVWRSEDGKRGEFRVHRIYGDVTTPLLKEALLIEAQVLGSQLVMDRGE